MNSTYTASALICTLWIVLVVCTWFLHPKKVSSVGKLPNEKALKLNSKQKKELTNNYNNNPYMEKFSAPFDDNMFQYQPKKASKKYKIPIAPQIEKIELPKSYDGHQSLLYQNLDNTTIRPLSRHYSPPYNVPGSWDAYNSSPPAAHSYYY